ncbi:MAG: hypothetical protein HYV63_32840 [Candidatus Schekmanbacteria bacterium]|nr:hypothetical protein [Candidatus Schekmanbacteria bacterium]
MLAAVRAWLPLLARDVPGFDAASYAAGSAVPDDLLADAERLAEQIEEARTPAGEPLPYAAAALAALDTATVAARQEWAEAEAADRQYQAQLAATRAAGAAFEEDLVAFRRTLLATAARDATSGRRAHQT